MKDSRIQETLLFCTTIASLCLKKVVYLSLPLTVETRFGLSRGRSSAFLGLSHWEFLRWLVRRHIRVRAVLTAPLHTQECAKPAGAPRRRALYRKLFVANAKAKRCGRESIEPISSALYSTSLETVCRRFIGIVQQILPLVANSSPGSLHWSAPSVSKQ